MSLRFRAGLVIGDTMLRARGGRTHAPPPGNLTFSLAISHPRNQDLEAPLETGRRPRTIPLRIFLSYPSKNQDLAEQLSLSLDSEGHTVFYDRTSLAAGQEFDRQIREEIERSDLLRLPRERRIGREGQVYADRADAGSKEVASSKRPRSARPDRAYRNVDHPGVPPCGHAACARGEPRRGGLGSHHCDAGSEESPE